MKIFLIIVFCTAALLIYYLQYFNKIDWFNKDNTKVSGVVAKDPRKKDKGDKGNSNAQAGSGNEEIEKEWQMPESLKEISGLSVIDDNRFACVQDEQEIIFIYNASTENTEQEIPFGNPDDYEGIAVAGNTAYVVTSDGKITEITDYRSKKPVIKSYTTPLTAKENVEGLCYDATDNCLLLAVKDKDANSKDYKGIYSFNVLQKKFINKPIYKIDLKNKIFEKGNKKKSKSSFSPSGISIHSQTGDVLGDPGLEHLVIKKG